MTWKEAKPAFFFLGRFVVIYMVLNFAYGWWVNSHFPSADPLTIAATHQTAFVLRACGVEVTTMPHPTKPAEKIMMDDKGVLSVYEGCNGVNVWIIFISFLFAFSGWTKNVLVFAGIGTVILYLASFLRIFVLFFIALHYPRALYFTHKYLFTILLYAVVFSLWFYWINYGRPRVKQR